MPAHHVVIIRRERKKGKGSFDFRALLIDRDPKEFGGGSFELTAYAMDDDKHVHWFGGGGGYERARILAYLLYEQCREDTGTAPRSIIDLFE